MSVGPIIIPIVKNGDLLAGQPIAVVDDGYAGIDSSGQVGFKALIPGLGGVLGTGRGGPLTQLTSTNVGIELAQRLTDTGRIIWRFNDDIFAFDGIATTTVAGPQDSTPIGLGIEPRFPSINNLGVAAFVASQAVLYHYDGAALTRQATPGVSLPSSGHYVRLGDHGFRRGYIGFEALHSNGSQVLSLYRLGDPPLPVIGDVPLSDHPERSG